MAHDVFVSYATRNKPVADAAVAALEAAGLRCWVAPRDIIPGHNYMSSIAEAIRHAKVVVLVFSSEANASSHVNREIQQAVDNGLPILPLKIDDADPTDSMSYALAGTHWLDAMTQPLEQHLRRLTGAVDALVGSDAPRLSPLPRTITAPQQPDHAAPVTPSAPAPLAVDPRYTSLAFIDSRYSSLVAAGTQPAAQTSSPAPQTTQAHGDAASHPPSPPVLPTPEHPGGITKPGTKHWWLFPLLSLGLLAPVPFIRAATRRPSRRWVLSAVAVSILSASVLLWQPSGDAAGGYYFFVWVGTTVFGWVSGNHWARDEMDSAAASADDPIAAWSRGGAGQPPAPQMSATSNDGLR